MQNFIQTGDWHIRVRPELPEEWQLKRYNMLCAEVIDLCKKHDAKLLLSGDILDRNRPSLIELQLLIELLICIADAGIDTWLISGNHEAIGQGECTYDYLVDVLVNINLRGRGRINYNTTQIMGHCYPEERVKFWFVGHPALQEGLTLKENVRRSNPNGHNCILITHVRATINQFIKEEVDIERLIEPFDLTFASDIHEAVELHDGRLIYTNNPLSDQFEGKPNHGCLLISADQGKVTWQRIPLQLPNLIQIVTTAEDYREPPDDGNFYRVEIKGSSADLREIGTDAAHVKLLKIPEIAETYAESEEAEEIRDMNLEEAFIEYMQSLDFCDDKIANMMEVYREP